MKLSYHQSQVFIVLTLSRSARRNTHVYKHIQCKCSYLDTLWHTYTHTYIHKCIYVWLCRHINTCMHIKTHTHTHTHSSYLTAIGVHEMHGRVYPNYRHTTILFIGLYLMMTHCLHVTGNLLLKTLVARQLPINVHTNTLTQKLTHIHTHITHTE